MIQTVIYVIEKLAPFKFVYLNRRGLSSNIDSDSISMLEVDLFFRNQLNELITRQYYCMNMG